jgi:PIN domain nuclease of toxin-antitoxin system
MDILLDTHALIWLIEGDSRLKPHIVREIESSASRVFISIATLWELGIKTAQGKILPHENIDFVVEFMRTWHMETLEISLAHVRAAALLPFHHGDPFDRMLVAQAKAENFRLVSGDGKIHLYDANVLW